MIPSRDSRGPRFWLAVVCWQPEPQRQGGLSGQGIQLDNKRRNDLQKLGQLLLRNVSSIGNRSIIPTSHGRRQKSIHLVYTTADAGTSSLQLAADCSAASCSDWLRSSSTGRTPSAWARQKAIDSSSAGIQRSHRCP